MSITAYKVEAVGHDRTGKDFGYVNIMYRYGGKQSCPRPDQCEKLEVMWADESVYGPPAPGSKVGDFIQTWLMGSWNCGVFTHREIAQRLMDTFTGLKVKELAWFENPREKTLKNGKPRARRAKWLPEQEVDLVYLYSDHYLDARNPTPAETDFFTVTRMDAWGVSTWFMCTPEAAGKLIAMDYDNLAVKETTIVGYAKDSRQVYFHNGDGKVKIIKGAEVSSFLSLGDTYFARDEKRIYAYGKQLPKADLPSWELLGHWYSRDAKRVYYLNREIKGADWDSFAVCTPLDAPPLADHLARDKEHFYQNDEMIEEPLWRERLQAIQEN